MAGAGAPGRRPPPHPRECGAGNAPGRPPPSTNGGASSANGKPRRIAVVVHSLSGGGVQRKALLIASGLVRRGHEVDVLLLRPQCDLSREIPDRCRIFYLPAGGGDRPGGAPAGLGDASARPVAPERAPWRVRCRRTARWARLHWKQLPFLARTEFPRWAEGVRAYLDRERPDAVLAMHVPSVVATTMAMRSMDRRIRVVATLHKLFRSRHLRRRISGSYPHADALVGISRDMSEGLSGITGVPSRRIHTIHNPIVSSDLLRESEAPSGHAWLDGSDRTGQPVLLAAGRLMEEKGFRTLLRAFAMLLARRRARLIVLGKGPQLPVLLSLAEDLGIREHVDFPGFVVNPYSFMARADLFVLSSRVEGLPTVLVEAMACGCPVVSTDCPFGPAEVLEGGRLGGLVPVGNAKALAEAMDLALSTSPDRGLLRGRAELFGVDRAVDRYEALLLDRLPHRGGAEADALDALDASDRLRTAGSRPVRDRFAPRAAARRRGNGGGAGGHPAVGRFDP